MAINKKTFTAADLDTNHELHFTHNLDNDDLLIAWYDENGIERGTSDLIQIVDENNIILRCGEAITGNHTLLIRYEVAGSSASGRKLFELDIQPNPPLDSRLVIGPPIINFKLSDFLDWIYARLGFLKVISNLKDLKDTATARNNLQVYSMAEINTELAKKASLYQAGSGAVIGTNNTVKFNPFSNYQPAMLRDVKNLGRRLLYAANVTGPGIMVEEYKNTDVLTTPVIINKMGTGAYRITHNRGIINYRVSGETLGTHSAYIACINKRETYFDIYIWDNDSLDDQDFEFEMYDYNPYTAD